MNQVKHRLKRKIYIKYVRQSSAYCSLSADTPKIRKANIYHDTDIQSSERTEFLVHRRRINLSTKSIDFRKKKHFLLMKTNR